MTVTAETEVGPSPRGSLMLWAGMLLVGLHVVVAVLTLLWTPYDPTALAGGRLEPPSWLHWAGTDRLGRLRGILQDSEDLIAVVDAEALATAADATLQSAARGMT